MAENTQPLLSPKTVRILELMSHHKQSMMAVMAAHPEVTPADLLAAAEEVMLATETLHSLGASEKVARGMGGSKRKGKGKKASSGDAFQIKITLRGSKPPIWRRVVVPVEIKLDFLHEVIQEAMGWYNGHLHAFSIDGEEFQGRGPDGYWDEYSDALDEADYRLCDLVAGEKDKFVYTYDFGDDWEHTLLIEKVIPASANPPMLTCLAGKNRCPLEDSGGLWGYYDKLRIMADPNDPEHEEIKEWVGEEINPTEFDLGEVNRGLAKLKP